MVAHAFNPALGRISEFEASLVYRVSSRATQRNPVSKSQKKKKEEEEEQEKKRNWRNDIY